VTGLGPTAELIELGRWAVPRWAGRLGSFLRTASPPGAVRSLPEVPAHGSVSGQDTLEDWAVTLVDQALARTRAVTRRHRRDPARDGWSVDRRRHEALWQGTSLPLTVIEFRILSRLVERLALALQGSLLVRFSPPAVADAFCATRLAGDGGQVFGTLPPGVDFDAIIPAVVDAGYTSKWWSVDAIPMNADSWADTWSDRLALDALLDKHVRPR